MRRIPRIRRDAAVLQPSSALRSANPQRRLALALPTSRTVTTTTTSSTPSSQRSTWAPPRPTQWRQYSTAPKDEKTAELQSVEDAQLAEIEAVSAELDEYYEAEPDIETDLVLPGDVEIAPNPSQVPDPEYVPALTGDGLEEVGGLQGYWEDDGHWTESKEIQIFGRKDKVTDPAVLEVLTRQAVVESLAVQGQQGSSGDVTLKGPWARGGAAERAAALGVHITVGEDASASLSGDVSGVARGLVEMPGAEAAEASHESLDAGEARELVKSWDSSWKQVSLQDAALKFAVTKRILQLSGHLLPDAKLAGTNTVGALLSVLVKPPKPKKLAEEIQLSGELTKLPNVTVYNRRVTSIDKEKMVGRWKVIAAELEKRDLPVTGMGGYTGMVEHSWVDGGESLFRKEQRWKKLLKKRAAKNHATT